MLAYLIYTTHKRLERSARVGGFSPRLDNYIRLLTADDNIHASGVDVGKPRGRNTHAPGCSCRTLAPASEEHTERGEITKAV